MLVNQRYNTIPLYVMRLMFRHPTASSSIEITEIELGLEQQYL